MRACIVIAGITDRSMTLPPPTGRCFPLGTFPSGSRSGGEGSGGRSGGAGSGGRSGRLEARTLGELVLESRVLEGTDKEQAQEYADEEQACTGEC